MDIDYGHWLDLRLEVNGAIEEAVGEGSLKSPKVQKVLRKIMKKMNDIESLTLDNYIPNTGENK